MLEIDSKTNVHEFKHMAREVGKFAFKAELFSMNYKGLDLAENFEIEVKKDSKERKVLIIFKIRNL